jgi:membrane associated rhomboid family serine protease
MRQSRQAMQIKKRWGTGTPSVVGGLVIINILCFVAQTITSYANPEWVPDGLALSRGGLRSLHVWQLFSYMFLHANLLHLLVNMLTLFFAGREVELIIGPRHLLGIYFLGGLLGGLTQMLFTPALGALIGASAAVCAVLIAFTTILPEMELTTLLFFIVPLRLRAKYFALSIVAASVLCLAFGLFPGVGHFAHLGGCLVGWLYAHQLGYGKPWWIQRYVFEKRARAERLKRMPPGQFIDEEIDPILEKISREGIQSLSWNERKILEKGREKIAQKTALRHVN